MMMPKGRDLFRYAQICSPYQKHLNNLVAISLDKQHSIYMQQLPYDNLMDMQMRHMNYQMKQLSK